MYNNVLYLDSAIFKKFVHDTSLVFTLWLKYRALITDAKSLFSDKTKMSWRIQIRSVGRPVQF